MIVNIRSRGLEKKNLQPLKTKHQALKAHLLLRLLFLADKRCTHNEEGMWTEILPGTGNNNNSNKLSSSIFPYLQAQVGLRTKVVCTIDGACTESCWEQITLK